MKIKNVLGFRMCQALHDELHHLIQKQLALESEEETVSVDRSLKLWDKKGYRLVRYLL